MNDKKAAKKILKRAKKHPDWYTPEEVLYAKQVKWRIKHEENQKETSSKTGTLDKKQGLCYYKYFLTKDSKLS